MTGRRYARYTCADAETSEGVNAETLCEWDMTEYCTQRRQRARVVR